MMFADSLLESAPHTGHRAAWTKLTSVVLQAVALSVALLLPLLRVQKLQWIPLPPKIQMMKVPAPRPMAMRASTAPSTPAAAAPTAIVQPRFVPRHISADAGFQEKTAEPAPNAWLACAGCRGGADSIVTNIVSSGPSVTTRPRAPVTPMRVSQMQLGDLIHKVVPEYPSIAKQIGLQGSVVLRAMIGKDGRVQNVQLVSGPPMLVHSAKAAVQQWQYRPYILNGEPMVVETQITVNFTLGR